MGLTVFSETGCQVNFSTKFQKKKNYNIVQIFLSSLLNVHCTVYCMSYYASSSKNTYSKVSVSKESLA